MWEMPIFFHASLPLLPLLFISPLSVTWDAVLRLAVVWELALLSAGSSRRGTVMAVI